MHVLLNEMKELAAQKKVPHRDFYNIRKVGLSSWLCAFLLSLPLPLAFNMKALLYLRLGPWALPLKVKILFHFNVIFCN